jgi:hypothetical protein
MGKGAWVIFFFRFTDDDVPDAVHHGLIDRIDFFRQPLALSQPSENADFNKKNLQGSN